MEKTRNTEEEKKMGQKWVKDRCMAGEFEQSVRIHTERLIGQQLFLPKGLRLDHFIGSHGLWQKLQNRELEVRIPIRVVAEQLLHQLVVAVQRLHIVRPAPQ